MPPSLLKEFKIKKKDRKSLSFDFKLKVLKRIESGIHRTAVARELGLAESTVRYIVKNADKIKNHFMESTSQLQPQRYYARFSIYAALEKHLFSWIEEMAAKKSTPVTPTMIKNEAKRVFKDLRQTHKGPETFTASLGWYNKFERTAKERNIDITGKTSSHINLLNFPARFNQCIETNNYSPKLVFNICVTKFYWRRLPAYLTPPGNNSAGTVCNDHFNLLLGCNAAGEAILPPLAVFRDHFQTALPELTDSQLSIVRRTSTDGQVTSDLFKEWYANYFCPFVNDYVTKNGLERKALILLDDGLCHCTDISNLLTDVSTEVLFVPEGVLQPLNQGAIMTFKLMYVYQLLEWLIPDTEVNREALLERLTSFNVVKALNFISKTWMQMEPCMLNDAWTELWPTAVVWTSPGNANKDTVIDTIVNKINTSGLRSIAVHEIESLLSSEIIQEESSIGDDVLSTRGDDLEDDVESVITPMHEKQDEKILTLEVIETALNHIDTALTLLSQHDNDSERITSVKKTILDSISCYAMIRDAQRVRPKQNTIYEFLKSVTCKPTLSKCEGLE